MDFTFTPDADGVIDLTTLDDDWFVAAGLDTAPFTSGQNPPSSSCRGDSGDGRNRLNRVNTTRGRPTIASHPSSAHHQRSVFMSGNFERPQYNYADHIPRPKIIYIKTEEHANEMVASLNGAIGLDLEWPFSRDKAGGEKEGKVALVQLCDADIILLIHVSKIKRFPRKVKELIESSKVSKMGVNIRNDGRKLFCDYGIISSNLIELGALACQIDSKFASTFNRPIVSLANMVSYYLKKTLDKGSARTSDWSKDLTREQMVYASNDVHSGLMVYQSLMKTARSSKVQLIPERYTADLANELRRRDDGPVNPQAGEDPHRYAYTLWRRGHGLLDICIRMGDRANPLKETAVISHIMSGLTEDPALPFSMSALVSLVKLDSSSWQYNQKTIEQWTQEGRGFDEN